MVQVDAAASDSDMAPVAVGAFRCLVVDGMTLEDDEISHRCKLGIAARQLVIAAPPPWYH